MLINSEWWRTKWEKLGLYDPAPTNECTIHLETPYRLCNWHKSASYWLDVAKMWSIEAIISDNRWPRAGVWTYNCLQWELRQLFSSMKWVGCYIFIQEVLGLSHKSPPRPNCAWWYPHSRWTRTTCWQEKKPWRIQQRTFREFLKRKSPYLEKKSLEVARFRECVPLGH
jgi:hypothetical protein